MLLKEKKKRTHKKKEEETPKKYFLACTRFTAPCTEYNTSGELISWGSFYMIQKCNGSFMIICDTKFHLKYKSL